MVCLHIMMDEIIQKNKTCNNGKYPTFVTILQPYTCTAVGSFGTYVYMYIYIYRLRQLHNDTACHSSKRKKRETLH